LRPITSRPSNVALADDAGVDHRGGIGAGSGLVRPKQGMSRPSASRGSQRSRCSLVPKCINSSPGPSEFGTITVTAAAIERVEIFRTTSNAHTARSRARRIPSE
jgi:hypothetical protein